MAPAFYIDTTATTDIQWISPTESYSFQRLTSLTSSAPYDFDRSDVYVDPYLSYTPKKEETRKERLIRWATAFKMFYKTPQYEVRKSKKECVAQQKEVAGRKEKFKGLNRNLIL